MRFSHCNILVHLLLIPVYFSFLFRFEGILLPINIQKSECVPDECCVFLKSVYVVWYLSKLHTVTHFLRLRMKKNQCAIIITVSAYLEINNSCSCLAGMRRSLAPSVQQAAKKPRFQPPFLAAGCNSQPHVRGRIINKVCLFSR